MPVLPAVVAAGSHTFGASPAGTRRHSRALRAATSACRACARLTLPQTYGYVPPMAYRIILPPLTSEFLNVIKKSARSRSPSGWMEPSAARAM